MSVPGERGHLAICHLELVEWARRTEQGDHNVGEDGNNGDGDDDLGVYYLYAVTNHAGGEDDDMIATSYM